MALDNPAFNRPAFQDPKSATATRGGAQSGQMSDPYYASQASAQQTAQIDGLYATPPAGSIDTDRMTVEDTVWKTVGLFAALLVTAVVGWVWTLSTVMTEGAPNMTPWLIGMIGGNDTYFEAALLLAMVGFVSTIAYCKFILRGDIVE